MKKKTTAAVLPSAEPSSPPLTFWPLFWKASFLSLGFAAVMLALTAVALAVWGYFQFRTFLKAADITQNTFVQHISHGWKAVPVSDQGHKNILILGTDGIEGRGNVPLLTDTMMLVSLNLQTGKINTLPLPRDLWSDEYQTKINALYYYGQERFPDQPERFPAEVISLLTGLPIHHTLVLSLEQLQALIEAVGGVEVTVANGFTDPLFPRSGVDVTIERDPAILYETVVFEPGLQTLSGERALQYIRSRHSEDDQGHDLARGQRQQQVIAALFSKLTNFKLFLTNPALAGKLYVLYQNDFEAALPLTELVATGRALMPQRENMQFASHELVDIDDDPINGVIDNPPAQRRYQNQWVYTIVDPAAFQADVHNKLYN